MIARVCSWLLGGVRGVRTAGAELLWPRGCAACGAGPLGEAKVGLCEECVATLEQLGPDSSIDSCGRCAAPRRVASPPGLGSPRWHPCADCRRLDPAVQQIRAAFAYDGALAVALMRLKWQGRDDLATPLGALLAPLLAAAARRCDVVTPVPLHPRRLRERGYNQAALLLHAGLRAQAGSPSGPPVIAGLLRRIRLTAPARDHGPRERQLRVAGAFVVPARHQRLLRGRRVLLVDDVVTTGATVSACAAALHAAGAVHVEAIALLRAAS